MPSDFGTWMQNIAPVLLAYKRHDHRIGSDNQTEAKGRRSQPGLNPDSRALQGAARRCFGQAPQPSVAAVPLRAIRPQNVAVMVVLASGLPWTTDLSGLVLGTEAGLAGRGGGKRRHGGRRADRRAAEEQRRQGSSTAAWPLATPQAGRGSRIRSASPSSQAVQAWISPCARSWTRQSKGSAGGAQPVQTGRVAVISVTSKAFGGSHGHGPGHGLDVEDVAGLAVVGGRS